MTTESTHPSILRKRSRRVLLLAEVLVVFLPLVYLLFWGVVGSIFALEDVVEDGDPSLLWVPLCVIGGVAGLAGVGRVVWLLLSGRLGPKGGKTTLAMLVTGAVAVIFPVIMISIEPDVPTFSPILLIPLPPLLVTAHLAYLARVHLFSRE